MIAVSNSSPLVIFSKLGCFHLLNKLFPRLTITAEVYQEVVVAGKGLPGASEVLNSSWIERRELRDPAVLTQARREHPLGAGELSTILLAKELSANVVLLDDNRARKLARTEGLRVMGSVGLLEALYARAELQDLRAMFSKLLSGSVYVDKRLLDRRLKAVGLPAL